MELRGIAEILGDERVEFRGDEFRDVVDLLDPKAFMTLDECTRSVTTCMIPRYSFAHMAQ